MSRRRIYLDTNVFIAAYESKQPRDDHAWEILAAIEDGEFTGVTSGLTLAGVLVKPLEDGDYDRAQRYQEIISTTPGFDVPSVDRSVLIEAATLRAVRKSLCLPDAIHVATARLNEYSHIVSDDRRMPYGSSLGIVQLGPDTLETIRDEHR